MQTAGSFAGLVLPQTLLIDMLEPIKKTAFVFAGGGSLGAVQVGMLQELTRIGLTPEFVIGSSVGAMNACHFAADPSLEGVERLASIWRGLRRSDIFPFRFLSLLGMARNRRGIVDPSSLRQLIERHLPYCNLQEAKIPVHVMATNLGGASVRLSSGSAVDAILASAAIPAAFPPVRIGDEDLIDGAVGNNTPVLTAIELGATRIVVLPTGFACALSGPQTGVIAHGLHAITLLVAHQLVRDLRQVHAKGAVEVLTVPTLCPLDVSPYDFSQSAFLIKRTAALTREWLAGGGLSRPDVPASLQAHRH